MDRDAVVLAGRVLVPDDVVGLRLRSELFATVFDDVERENVHVQLANHLHDPPQGILPRAARYL